MFSISSLYENYTKQTKEKLINLIESELSSYTGLGYANIIAQLKKCIEIAEDYTNNHQKNASALKNEKGECIRHSGEPYINHPLRVVLILIHERLFDEDVLKAALMHDLFEDTTYTYNDAKRDFDMDVADLIDCVTNVSEYQQNSADEGISKEELDYAGIINKCNEHKNAFYIKFADRLDNLMTLDAMPKEKQAQKIEDTRNYIFPLLKRFNAHRFQNYIDNAIFKIEEEIKPDNSQSKYAIIKERLEQLHAFSSVNATLRAIEKTFKKQFVEIRLIKPSIYEIYNTLIKRNKDLHSFSQSDFNYDIYLIAENETTIPSLSAVLNEFLSYNLIDYAISHVGQTDFELIDDIRNRYNVHLISSNDFNVSQYGSTDVDLIIANPDDIYDKLVLKQIPVYTPKHERKMIPVGSTVIDFAFIIHKDLCKYMVGADVNGKLVPVYTRLKANDEVKIVTSENPKDEIQPNWILYCETKGARRAIYKRIKQIIDELNKKINKYEN